MFLFLEREDETVLWVTMTFRDRFARGLYFHSGRQKRERYDSQKLEEEVRNSLYQSQSHGYRSRLYSFA